MASSTKYDEFVSAFAVVTILVVIVAAFVCPTTSLLFGEATATQSFLAVALATRSFTIVVCAELVASGAIKKSTSTISLSSNKSNPEATSVAVRVAEFTPFASSISVVLVPVNVREAASSPKFA